MANIVTTPGMFKSSKAETKLQVTDNAARAIVNAEATARDKKTARLRAARLAQEAVEPQPAPATKPVKKAAGGKARKAKA